MLSPGLSRLASTERPFVTSPTRPSADHHDGPVWSMLLLLEASIQINIIVYIGLKSGAAFGPATCAATPCINSIDDMTDAWCRRAKRS